MSTYASLRASGSAGHDRHVPLLHAQHTAASKYDQIDQEIDDTQLINDFRGQPLSPNSTPSKSVSHLYTYILCGLAVIALALIGLHNYVSHYITNTSISNKQFTIATILTGFNPSDTINVNTTLTLAALSTYIAAVSTPQQLLVYVDTEDICSHLQQQFDQPSGAQFQCYSIPCWHKQYIQPVVQCTLEHAHAAAPTEYIAFINTPALVGAELSSAIDYIHNTVATTAVSKLQSPQQWVAVAKHNTLTVPAPLVNEWQQWQAAEYLLGTRFDKQVAELVKMQKQQAKPADSIDLFVYSKSQLALQNIPNELLMNTQYWDTHLLSQWLIAAKLQVIDVSASVRTYALQPSAETPNAVAPVNAVVVENALMAAHHNLKLIKAVHKSAYKYGKVSNAPSNIRGVCPGSRCKILPSDTAADGKELLFVKRASDTGYLVVLTVNAGYIPLALNWVCWADRINFTNYVLIAEDKKSARLFSERGVPVLVSSDASESKTAADYGSVEFQETMTFRTEFLMTVLLADIHFVTADMDGLWLDDPIQFFNQSVDLTGQTHKGTKISGGFVVVRATTQGKKFWNQVIECQRANAHFLALAAPGSYEPSKYTEQYCVNELSRIHMSNNPAFTRDLLDVNLFPDGKAFFDEKLAQLHGVAPSVIHNNWIMGAGGKLGRLQQWHLHSAETDDINNMKCIDLPLVPPPALQDSTVSLKIRVFAYNKVESLAAMLQSLLSATYPANTNNVHMQISIDKPASVVNSNSYEVAKMIDGDVTKWLAVKEMVQTFAWPYGQLSVIEQTEHIGLFGQYSEAWLPRENSDNEVMMVLYDSMRVSPDYYTYIQSTVNQYYRQSFDARVFGVSLRSSNLILAETNTIRFSDHSMKQSLSAGNTMYKYQLPITAGTVYFPSHWRAFVAFLSHNSVHRLTGLPGKSATPCVPTLLSNKWWQDSDAYKIRQWMTRYMYENGLYLIYYNNEQQLVIDEQQRVEPPAQHAMLLNISAASMSSQLRQSQLLSAIDMTQIANLPNTTDIPVYDLHFRYVPNTAVLAWRQYLTGPPDAAGFDECHTIDQLQNKLDAMAAKQRAEIEAKEAKKAAEKAKKEADKAAKKAEDDAKKAIAKAKKDAADKVKADAAAAAKAAKAVTVKPTTTAKPTATASKTVKLDSKDAKSSSKSAAAKKGEADNKKTDKKVADGKKAGKPVDKLKGKIDESKFKTNAKATAKPAAKKKVI